MKKIIPIEEVMSKIKNGMTIMIGGFLGVGTPHTLIDSIIDKNSDNLTIITNDTAFPDVGVGKLIVNKQVKKVITSHIGTNVESRRQLNQGTLEVNLVPQGTLIEQIRAGGSGLGGVLTPTGVGTIVEKGKEKIIINNREYLLELPLRADVALIGASKVDEKGNCFFNETTRNFNPLIAMAADLVIVECEDYVRVGDIDPHLVMVPGEIVDFIIKGDKNEP